MKSEINISLTNAELEVVNYVLRAAQDVMYWDEKLDCWRADYESFICNLSQDEMSALQTAAGKI